MLHPESTPLQPLVSLDVHFARVSESRAHCLRRTERRPASCATPEHHAFAAAAAHDWSPALRRRFGPSAVALSVHGGLLRVHVAPQHVRAAAALMAQQPLVATVAASTRAVPHSLPTAAAIAQSSTPLTGGGGGGALAATAAAQHPLWKAGLTGKGQVIGMGDSGLDMAHCAFADAEVPFENFDVDEYSVPRFASDTHRKVALYYMLADAEDDADGHGTHVAGIAAGAPADGGTDGRGVAYEARLAFVDLGRSRGDRFGGMVAAPYDLGSKYFPRTFAAGARLHSDSWGSNTVTYDAEAASLDRFSHATPSFLSVFSAGNYGQYKTEYATTVNSPALAKNAVAVGNSLNAGYAPRATPAAPVHNVQFTVAAAAASLVHTARVLQAGFSGAWPDLAAGAPVVLAEPLDACADLTNRAAAAGAVLLVRRGACDYDTKVQAAEAAGAAAVVVGNMADEYAPMARTAPGAAALPVGMVPLADFEALEALLASPQGVTAAHGGEFDLAGQPAWQSVNPTSSTGPTADGRLKPDLVAPGTIDSADSGTACGLRPGEGTSMAAPVVAGAAAIVRQYLAEGFYPGGARGGGVAHDASGPLVKALLVGGAQPLLGYAGSGGVPVAAPSGVQGWGRVSLADALPLADDAASVSNLQFVDLEALTADAPEHTYCVAAAGGAPLTVTLVWHDPAAEAAAGEGALVNDLDLELRVAALGGLTLHSKGGARPDRANNVERVRLEAPPSGQVVVGVRAARLMTDRQQYALTVQGAFSGLLQSGQNPAVRGGEGATATCDVLAAVITIKPPALTADGAPAFAFTTRNGAEPALGFECELKVSEGGGGDAAHEWRECGSPQEYSGLKDGSYIFSVRIAGEELAESHKFEVDISPPVTTILPDFGFANTSALAVPLPPASSAEQVAAFAFVAKDRSDTTLTCTLRVPDGADAAPAGDYAPEFKPNEPYACTSPQVFSMRSPGIYAFEVYATDASGNKEMEPQVHAFAVAFPDDAAVVHIAGVPWGRTNQLTHELQLAAVQGAGGAAADPDGFEYETATLEDSGQGNSTWDSSAWAPVATGDRLVFEAPEDGEYRVRVRAGAAAPPTAWRFTIDSTPPTIAFDVEPPAVAASTTVLMRVSADEEGVAWHCALVERAAESVEASLLKPCDGITAEGTLQWPDLTDGSDYTFALRATDTFGNESPVAYRQWLVDATAPEVHRASWPQATRATAVTLRFGVTDGAAGTGVASVECGVRWLGNGPQPEADWAPCAEGPAPGDGEIDGGPGACVECTWFQQELDTEDEGRWGLTVRTADNANLTRTTEEAVVVVDRSPPSAAFASGGVPRSPSPPSFQFELDTVNAGAYKSEIRGALCALLRPGDAVPEAFTVQAAAALLLPETTDAAAAAVAGGGDFEVVGPDGGAAPAAHGVWHECGQPVAMRGVRSGTYSFRAKPLDAAGNVGATLQQDITVDESLAPDDAVAVGGERRGVKGRTWGVVGAVVGAILLLVLLGVGLAWKRRRSRRAARAAAPLPGPGGTHGRVAGSGSDSTSRIMAEQGTDEQSRVARALELSRLEAGLQASRAAARDETALKLAIEASLSDAPFRR